MGKKLVALAVILGLAASFTVYSYIKKVEQEARQRRLAQVVVAVKDIPAREQITAEMVALKDVPVESIHPRAARKLEEVVGTVTLFPLVGGEPVLLSRLARPGEGRGGLAFQIPPGKRAVAISVDEVRSVGFLVKQGDTVDVLLKVPVKAGGTGSGSEEVPVALTILQNVEVLAVGRSLEQPRVEAAGKEGENKQSPQQAKEVATVTLAVEPEEAQVLLLASELGSVRLALRSPVDREKRVLEPIDTEKMIKKFGGGAGLLDRLRREAEMAGAREKAESGGTGLTGVVAPPPFAENERTENERWSVFSEK
ncbi:Flp pilus assembly protein CpaB [Desulfofundulus thermosubterraneus]|uniref:Pilus assembly protein CpaB n=1 Tax=Desulfofundulus thermosubterraneus DSM 16057 TaxID=1121432 RepID=A0A1M6D839_9FIRM|nr:Flp pilus assembly protein CpaB [Desulfofundulus thermosubterraneus]SHI69344.1 pilus assembly protein CpaB [Desulfofundulus thermosubterraneus DSM 16057]